MIYIKENGVTVEDNDGGDLVTLLLPNTVAPRRLWANHEEAEVLLRGLLRWKLERKSSVGTVTVNLMKAWMSIEYDRWCEWRKERNR